MPQMSLLSGSYLLPPVVNGDARMGAGRGPPSLFGACDGETFWRALVGCTGRDGDGRRWPMAGVAGTAGVARGVSPA